MLDLKTADGLDILLRLVGSADVLVHNFRPSVPARLGIDYPRLRAINPRLIYCAVTGFGDTGPFRDRAGFDQLLQAMTGICALQGTDPDHPEIVWGSVVDYYTSSMLAFAVSSALFLREKTGHGQQLGVSLLQSALAMQSARVVAAVGEPRHIDRDFRSMGTTGIYPTAEGHLYVTTTAPHFWTPFCEKIGLPQLADDPRYDTVRKRADRAAELIPQIGAALKARTAAAWETLLGESVPCAAVRSTGDLFDHPQALAQGLICDFEHPVAGPYRGFGRPASFSASPCPAPFSAPTFGQHSREILARHGFSAGEIDRFISNGAIQVDDKHSTSTATASA